MSLVVLDSDVASGILRQRLPDRARARLAGKIVFISFVTLGELTKWTVLRLGPPARHFAQHDGLDLIDIS